MERTILHCDCNGFFASVECLDRPELKNVPMAVAGDVENRHGIILAKNELAKPYGIRTAETVWQAKKKCPSLVLVPPRGGRYAEISAQVNNIYLSYTDQVEPFGIDESFLDLTGSLALFGMSGPEMADKIRCRVREEIGVTISVGVSFNKVFAKLGSDMKKPDATTVIGRENFRDLVWPLPVSALLFVGRASEELFLRHGVKTIGDLAAADRRFLLEALGKGGETLWRYANGLDVEPVRRFAQKEEAKSVGCGRTFPRDIAGFDELRSALAPLADEVAARLRRARLKCRAVQLQIKSPELKLISRQAQLRFPTALQREIADAALLLLKANWKQDAPVRALTVTAIALVREAEATEQLSLFDEGADKREKLEKLERAVDEIRRRFGERSIGVAQYRAGAEAGGGEAEDPKSR